MYTPVLNMFLFFIMQVLTFEVLFVRRTNFKRYILQTDILKKKQL